MSISCKHCSHPSVVKNGHVRGKQRYKCKSCGYNFTLGDARAHPNAAARRAFAILLYGIGKSSYGFITKLFGVTPAAVQKWIKKEADLMQEPEISSDIMEIEFDEMWHFIESKKTKNGSSRPWIVLQAEPSPGLQAVVMLQPSQSSMTKLST